MGKKSKGRKSFNGFGQKTLSGKTKIVNFANNNQLHVFTRSQILKVLKFNTWRKDETFKRVNVETKSVPDGINEDEFLDVMEFMDGVFKKDPDFKRFEPIHFHTSNSA